LTGHPREPQDPATGHKPHHRLFTECCPTGPSGTLGSGDVQRRTCRRSHSPPARGESPGLRQRCHPSRPAETPPRSADENRSRGDHPTYRYWLRPGDRLACCHRKPCVRAKASQHELRQQSLTDFSQTDRTVPDSGAQAGHPADPDLRFRTVAYWMDVSHWSTDQKVGGRVPSERAQVTGPYPPRGGLFRAVGSHVGSHRGRSGAEQCPAHGRGGGPR